MKIGDVIYSTNVRGGDYATVIDAEVKLKEKNTKAGKKTEVRTKYTAKFKDGTLLVFYGFDIGRSVFKFEEPDNQMNLSDFMEM